MGINRRSQIFNPAFGLILLVLGIIVSAIGGPTYEWFGPEWTVVNYIGFGISVLAVLQFCAWVLTSLKP